MNNLIDNVLSWGVSRGITGPNGKGTLLKQFDKSQEELTEARDAAVLYLDAIQRNDKHAEKAAHLGLKDGIGDTMVTLILAAELAGTTAEECPQTAYDVIKGRNGKMIDGTFIKEVQA